ncbi:MAG: multiple sugar transport system permease protein, partial [Kribbellaceae bacterium]|nr:multiple sugar transport system permease protein [Kribbellaceae bacterium]
MSTLTTSRVDSPASTPGLTTAGREARRTRFLQWVAVHTLAIAAALFFVLPFVFVFLTALMSDQQALTRNLWPDSWHWENLRTVWETPGFLTWWKNTLVYAVLGTVLTLVSSIPVAYALARFKFKGRNLAMMLVISTMMLPPQVVIVPMYL